MEALALELAVSSGATAAELDALLGEHAEAGGGTEGGDEAAASSTMAAPAQFTQEELSWGRKEAKVRLGPEEFKAWRKTVRKLAHNNKAGGVRDDFE